MLAGFRRHVLVIAALVLALALVGAAVSAAAGSSYRGKVKGGGKLTFRTTATSVVGFKTSVTVVCISVAAAKSNQKIYPVLLQSPTKLKSGHFKINFKGPSSTFINVTGIVKAKSASGRIDVRYTSTIGMDIYACSSKGTWTAKKV
jgi:hypothetical protein